MTPGCAPSRVRGSRGDINPRPRDTRRRRRHRVTTSETTAFPDGSTTLHTVSYTVNDGFLPRIEHVIEDEAGFDSGSVPVHAPPHDEPHGEKT